MKRILLVVVLGLGVALAGALWLAGRGSFGRFDSEDTQPRAPARSAKSTETEREAQTEAARAVGASSGPSQILFGDLHVHTTISFDAFMLNLPIMGGEGAHPLADACDFARHCAGLDFWSINDHAANILPEDWRNTIDSIRQCNAVAGDAADPDMVSFLGWEWTQAGRTPDTHYGHKNVVLAHTDDDRIPTRPIAASSGGLAASPPPVWARGALALQGGRFHDMAKRWTAISEVPVCDEGDVRSLPADCREIAPTPVELFRKLDEWSHDSIVIPHGTSWGIYSPPGSGWDKQLTGAMHDPARQTLLEIYSGHGDAEPYRDWRSVDFPAASPNGPAASPNGADRAPTCPEERPDYLPMCRRAGQIVQARCEREGHDEAVCAERAAQARAFAAAAGVSAQVTVPGATAQDWLDAGQCRDCDQPAFNYRPMGSAQYIAALTDFSEAATSEDPPRRFRMGFIASSDIHTARPGVGYKEFRWQSDSRKEAVVADGIVGSFFRAAPEAPVAQARSFETAAAELSGIQLFESERTQSFLYTGGLVAVHAQGRDREAIWSSLSRREVYGTSGPRILLWFDLLHESGSLPMGSEIALRDAPVFRVRAVGSFEPAPGCSDEATQALGAQRLEQLCRGECYRMSDQRRRIERIEIVRIRPQRTANEAVVDLVDDPWRSFDCPDDRSGCSATFVDEEFPTAARDSLYYARVLEAPTPAVNGATLRCHFDDAGRCTATDPCGPGQDCLAPHAQRAWSSPIYVDWAAR